MYNHVHSAAFQKLYCTFAHIFKIGNAGSNDVDDPKDTLRRMTVAVVVIMIRVIMAMVVM